MSEQFPQQPFVDAMVDQAERTVAFVRRIEDSLDPEKNVQAYQEAVKRFFEAQEERTLWDVRYNYGPVEDVVGGVQLFIPNGNSAYHISAVARLYAQLQREARAAGFYLESTDREDAPIYLLRPLQKNEPPQRVAVVPDGG